MKNKIIDVILWLLFIVTFVLFESKHFFRPKIEAILDITVIIPVILFLIITYRVTTKKER